MVTIHILTIYCMIHGNIKNKFCLIFKKKYIIYIYEKYILLYSV